MLACKKTQVDELMIIDEDHDDDADDVDDDGDDDGDDVYHCMLGPSWCHIGLSLAYPKPRWGPLGPSQGEMLRANRVVGCLWRNGFLRRPSQQRFQVP